MFDQQEDREKIIEGEKTKRKAENKKQKPSHNLSPNISIIKLDVSALNIPLKDRYRQR